MRLLLLWDIDGTLISSGGAGQRALQRALQDVFGIEGTLDDIDFAGRTDPWIMREMLGLSRTIELTLTGRMMDARECHQLGLIHHLVAADEVRTRALEIAAQLAAKPPVALRLDKQRFQEMTEAGFRDAMQAAARLHHESYESGEPARMMQAQQWSAFIEAAAGRIGSPHVYLAETRLCVGATDMNGSRLRQRQAITMFGLDHFEDVLDRFNRYAVASSLR